MHCLHNYAILLATLVYEISGHLLYRVNVTVSSGVCCPELVDGGQTVQVKPCTQEKSTGM